jgi:hypothetical protein
MPDNRKSVQNLTRALQDAGIVSFDAKLSDLLGVLEVADFGDGSEVESGAVVWDGYILIYKGDPGGLEELKRLTGPGLPT